MTNYIIISEESERRVEVKHRLRKNVLLALTFSSDGKIIGRKCRKCQEVKPINQFPKPTGGLNVCWPNCLECEKKRIREYARRFTTAEKNSRLSPSALEKQKIAKRNHSKTQRHLVPEKIRARDAIYKALKTGKIKRLPCEVCSNPKSEAHHEDYAKKLDVIWLCKKHHGERHRIPN